MGKKLARRTFRVVEKGEFIEGEDLSWYHDGSVKAYKLWKAAVPEGRAYGNHPNGKLAYEEFYKEQYKAGTWRYYDQKGVRIREFIYPVRSNKWDSKKEDVTRRYYAAGKLLYTEEWKAGKLVRSDGKKTVVKAVPKTELTDGKELFRLKCAACHAKDKDGYGPALKDVVKKRNKDWLYMMIRNGMKLVEAGDKDAVALYNHWGKKKHLNMEYLSNKQVQAIIDYLKKF